MKWSRILYSYTRDYNNSKSLVRKVGAIMEKKGHNFKFVENESSSSAHKLTKEQIEEIKKLKETVRYISNYILTKMQDGENNSVKSLSLLYKVNEQTIRAVLRNSVITTYKNNDVRTNGTTSTKSDFFDKHIALSFDELQSNTKLFLQNKDKELLNTLIKNAIHFTSSLKQLSTVINSNERQQMENGNYIKRNEARDKTNIKKTDYNKIKNNNIKKQPVYKNKSFNNDKNKYQQDSK